jgi:hypothetical protein
MQSVVSVGCVLDSKTLFAKAAEDKTGDRRLIFDNQNANAHR